MNKIKTIVAMLAVVFIVGSGAGVVSVYSALSTPFSLDLSHEENLDLIERPWDYMLYFIEQDPFGNDTIFFPPGGLDQAPPEGAGSIARYVTLDIPDIDNFTLSLKSLGYSIEDPRDEYQNGGNRTVGLIFGYQDPANYWYVYLASSTNGSQFYRIEDGRHKRICESDWRWRASNVEYQEAKITLSTEGENKVLRVLVNDKPTGLDGCTFPAEDYRAGKIGFGGNATSSMRSWYFKDIVLDVN